MMYSKKALDCRIYIDIQDLADIGTIILAYNRVVALVHACLKPLEGLNFSAWIAAERLQYGQLIRRLETAAQSYAEVSDAVKSLKAKIDESTDVRNRIAHGQYVGGENTIGIIDWRRQKPLSRDQLDNALNSIIEARRMAEDCFSKVVELIVSEVIPQGSHNEPGIWVGTRIGNIKF